MPDPEPSRLSRFLSELRRRHVVRALLGYTAMVFVVLQLSEIVLPAFLVTARSDAVIRVLVILGLLFLPVVLALAWIYEITPRGVRSMRELDAEAGIAEGGRVLPRVALLVITIAVGWGGWIFSKEIDFVSTESARDTFQAAATTDASSPINSVAVLPLEDQSASADDAYFASSMHEAITSAVSQLAGLRVISRTSVLRYDQEGKSLAQMGSELNVDAIIEGSVVVVDGQVRTTVQLIHTASDTHVWASNYTREFVNVLALQDEVAREIALEIGARVRERTPGDQIRVAELDGDRSEGSVPSAPTSDEVEPGADGGAVHVQRPPLPAEVQRDYLRGRYLLTEGSDENVEQARIFFEGALEEEPDFAPALPGLAGTSLVQAFSLDGFEQLAGLLRSRDLAKRALEVDPDNVEAKEVRQSAEDALGFSARDSALRMVRIRDGALELPSGDTIRIDAGPAPVVTTLGEMLRRRPAVDLGESAGRADVSEGGVTPGLPLPSAHASTTATRRLLKKWGAASRRGLRCVEGRRDDEA